MGMVASIANTNIKQEKSVASLIDNKGTLQENVGTMDGKRIVFPDKRGNQRNRQRVLDKYPTHIKLVKNPPPDLYPTDYYTTQDRRRMFLHDDTVRNRLGDSIMYREPGFPEPRRIILYDKQRVQGPKKLVLYDPSRYDHSKPIMDYDPTLSDKHNFSFQNKSSNNFRADQNLSYLKASHPSTEDVFYYKNKSYGYDDSYRKINLLNVFSTPSRRNSDSLVLSTRDLAVETFEKYHKNDYKIYKIVKPIGGRPRIIINEPEIYERFLIVGSSIDPKTLKTQLPSVGSILVPGHDLVIGNETEDVSVDLEILVDEPKMNEVIEQSQTEIPEAIHTKNESKVGKKSQ